MQNGDHLPLVRTARNPGNQSILAFDTDLGDAEEERLLNGGDNGFNDLPVPTSLGGHGSDGEKCGTDSPSEPTAAFSIAHGGSSLRVCC